MKSIFIVALIFINCNCGFVARKGYGAKKSKIENGQTVELWLKNNGLNPQNMVSVSPEYFYDFMPGLSQAPLLFDRESGNLLAIGFANGKYCPQEVDKSFSSLLPYQLLKEKPDSLLISEVIVIPPGVSTKEKDKFERQRDTVKLNLAAITKKMASLNGVQQSIYRRREMTTHLFYHLQYFWAISCR